MRVDTYYGPIHILQGVSIAVRKGELVALLGGNASGKSTTLKTILGIVSPRRGRVLLDGEDVTRRSTSYRVCRGVAIVPENRRLFAPMTVVENLEMGAYPFGGGRAEDYERVYSLFPLLYERRKQLAGTLSGGEQQMVAMGRALMARPRCCSWTSPRWASRRSSSSAASRSSSRCTRPAWRSSWSSRTRTCRSRSPTAATCSRPGASCSIRMPQSLLANEELRKAYLGR